MSWPHGRDLHGHTVEACMAAQKRPAWPHRDKNGLHGHTGEAFFSTHNKWSRSLKT